MANFLGLTIGPIGRFLMLAGSTGELWGTSYIFSYISQQLVERLCNSPNFELISPAKLTNTENLKGAGLYPDRLYFSCTEKDQRKIASFLDKTITETFSAFQKAFEIDQSLKTSQKVLEKPQMENIEETFYIYYTIIKKSPEIETNPLPALNKQLDNLELRPKGPLHEDSPWILKYLDNQYIKNTNLYRKAFGISEMASTSKRKLHISENFPCTAEIAANQWDGDELYIKNEMKSFNSLTKESREYLAPYITSDNLVRKPIKYIALVRADGDHVVSTLSKMEGISRISEFSSKMLEFSREAVRQVAAYGGFMMYAGGDDLLFLAPVINFSAKGNDKNIFELIKSLDELFKDKLGGGTSLSFGVTLSYYKFPLYEALELSQNLLFGKAKNYREEKNVLSLALYTNSGSETEISIGLDEENFSNILELINTIGSNNSNTEFRKSYQGTISANRALLSCIAHEPQRLDAWMDNNFPDEKGSWHFDLTKKILKGSAQELNDLPEGERRRKAEEVIDRIVAILKIARFFGEKEDLVDE